MQSSSNTNTPRRSNNFMTKSTSTPIRTTPAATAASATVLKDLPAESVAALLECGDERFAASPGDSRGGCNGSAPSGRFTKADGSARLQSKQMRSARWRNAWQKRGTPAIFFGVAASCPVMPAIVHETLVERVVENPP
jgi:hypothetical protein